MITLNQLIILYKDIAARHKQVNDFAAVQDFNIGADSTHSYPILVVNPTSANLPRTQAGYTSFTTVFDLQVIDLVNKDNGNRMDILSDTQEILNDVVNEFNTHPYYIDAGIDTINNITFTPLRGVYDSDVDGWKISMELEHPNKLSYCGNPIENLSGFDFTPASVTVIDGLNTFDLFPSDSYTCDTPAPPAFKIDNSFLFDGVNENFSIPNADLSSILQGNVDVSFNFVFKPDATETIFEIWSNGNTIRGIYIIYYATANYFSINYNNNNHNFKFPLSAITLGAWNSTTMTLDTVNKVCNLYVNGVSITLQSSTTPTTVVDSNTNDFNLGGNNIAGFGYLEGYINQMSIIGRKVTLAEHIEWYNNGKPLDSQDYFNVECKYFFNTDNSGSTAQFSVLDSVNSITATSVNMEDTDKTNVTPYI
jgi:hypothetical protein